MSKPKVSVYDIGRKFLVLRWTDPVTGKLRQKSAKTRRPKEAEREAAILEADIANGRYREPKRISWEDFRDRYETEKVPGLAPRTAESVASALNHVERILKPRRLADLTSSRISELQAGLRKCGIKDTTTTGHLAHLRAALGWAKKVGILDEVPNFSMPRKQKGRKLMRGRPVTAEEFDRMLAVIPRLRPSDASAWQRLLEGLWLSGLRLGEAVALKWEAPGNFVVDLDGRYPQFRIVAEGEKGFRDRCLPMTPDFARWLLATPVADRVGLVFGCNDLRTGKPLSAHHVGKIISRIGKAARVVVNISDGKTASAHDLRRAFGTRWAYEVKPAVLQILMRHSSIETTLRYYVGHDADEVAALLWRQDSGRWTADQREAADNRPAEPMTAACYDAAPPEHRERLAGVEGAGNEAPRVGQTGFIASGHASRRVDSNE